MFYSNNHSFHWWIYSCFSMSQFKCINTFNHWWYFYHCSVLLLVYNYLNYALNSIWRNWYWFCKFLLFWWFEMMCFLLFTDASLTSPCILNEKHDGLSAFHATSHMTWVNTDSCCDESLYSSTMYCCLLSDL